MKADVGIPHVVADDQEDIRLGWLPGCFSAQRGGWNKQRGGKHGEQTRGRPGHLVVPRVKERNGPDSGGLRTPMRILVFSPQATIARDEKSFGPNYSGPF